jgi:hypothetical protein
VVAEPWWAAAVSAAVAEAFEVAVTVASGRTQFLRRSIFYGPSFGFYDPFWWPYAYPYPYSYYPPRVVYQQYVPPPADYLAPPQGPAPESFWYHCDNPEGYYPMCGSAMARGSRCPCVRTVRRKDHHRAADAK